MMIIINTQKETLRFRCFRVDVHIQNALSGLSTEEAELFKKMNKSILFDYEGNRFLSNYDIGKGFFRQCEVEDVYGHDAERISNDDLVSVTKEIKLETLRQIISRYQKENQLKDNPLNQIPIVDIAKEDVPEFPSNVNRIYVHSHMGTGKTKQLFEYMNTFVQKNPEARITIITFRVTFAQDMLAKLNAFMRQKQPKVQFVCYKDVKSQLITTKYLIVQVESINRVKLQGARGGLLVLDESESIYEQLSSGLSSKEIANLANFKGLVRFSSNVIAMDAYLQERTVDLTERFARNLPPTEELKDIGNVSDVVVVRNSWQRYRKYIVYKGRSKKDLWLQDIIRSVLKGEKVVIPCNSALIAKAVHKALSQLVPNTYTLQVFTQDVNEQQRIKDLQNV